jgi:hypothetical protein
MHKSTDERPKEKVSYPVVDGNRRIEQEISQNKTTVKTTKRMQTRVINNTLFMSKNEISKRTSRTR